MGLVTMGIDPGKSGGIVVLEDGDRPLLRRVTPTIGKEYDDRAMFDLLVSWRDRVNLVVLEAQSVRPGEARARCYTTGLGFGLWRMALIASKAPWELVQPGTWVRSMLAGCPGEGKDRNLIAAQRRVPNVNLVADLEAGGKSDRSTKAHLGIVDAALLARWGWQFLVKGGGE